MSRPGNEALPGKRSQAGAGTGVAGTGAAGTKAAGTRTARTRATGTGAAGTGAGPLADRAAALAAGWAPVAARVLLGLVLAWFGYHELVQPSLWTGYVPVLPPTSSLAAVLVLAHGWLLLLLAVALVAGIATRLAALLAALLLLEIVVALIVAAGLSDLTLRDVGVLGLAICLTGVREQRLALRR